MPNIHWFPGHMNRALREIAEKVSLVDLVVELRDARAVLSSTNNDVIQIIKNRKKLIVLTKSDLADEKHTRNWINFFKQQGIMAIAVNLLVTKDIARLIKEISATDEQKRSKEAARGMKPQPLRIMVVGVPNVGKSTLINKLAKKKATQVENRPGKTKAQQWIKVGNEFELLDTPGVLPMKFASPELATNLALLGMVKEATLPIEDLALKIITLLRNNYADKLISAYSLDNIFNISDREILTTIAIKSGALQGGLPDISRAAMMILNDFRNGKITRLSLETI